MIKECIKLKPKFQRTADNKSIWNSIFCQLNNLVHHFPVDLILYQPTPDIDRTLFVKALQATEDGRLKIAERRKRAKQLLVLRSTGEAQHLAMQEGKRIRGKRAVVKAIRYTIK